MGVTTRSASRPRRSPRGAGSLPLPTTNAGLGARRVRRLRSPKASSNTTTNSKDEKEDHNEDEDEDGSIVYMGRKSPTANPPAPGPAAAHPPAPGNLFPVPTTATLAYGYYYPADGPGRVIQPFPMVEKAHRPWPKWIPYMNMEFKFPTPIFARSAIYTGKYRFVVYGFLNPTVPINASLLQIDLPRNMFNKVFNGEVIVFPRGTLVEIPKYSRIPREIIDMVAIG
ncbi:hypothetical protein Hypma_014352 [Hypsizygus marmoreus]|uniref:Uncharacterized protein n=1 Tax=Hypsizygus marmoreus TaxID=39966 RepID=A0A369JCK1_HYPMA|nr:hypothetical protein Hypma_014352 [Hypsizygus marmoreus]